jgi:hypothetical protein
MQIDDYFQKNPSSSAASAHFEQRGSQFLIEVLKCSYPPLDKQSILHALSMLLNTYQVQVIKLHETLPLDQDVKTYLNWINILINLCESTFKS